MFKLNYKYHFDAAHHLENYDGKCSNLHGHRWEVEIEIFAKEKKSDMLVDFNVLKEVVDELDHKNLNEVLDFNPTCENITYYLWQQITKVIDENYIATVQVWESPNASIKYED